MTGSMYLPYASVANVEASRLGDGLRSDLYHALIVVDPTKLSDLEMGERSDFIAMLTLAQVRAFDACQSASSITNLLSANYDTTRRTKAITDIDLAYLRGLYGMDAGGTLLQQRHDIAYQMKKSLQNR